MLLGSHEGFLLKVTVKDLGGGGTQLVNEVKF
ncbi:hypothetical protein Vi05172_g12801 [Venturia inaequalis]|nr:hypothetical protein Vi05172_g12801 [Venturia inaequalis]